PKRIFKGMYKALTVAFFSRSSGTALPITMECAKENLKISDRVASFSLPLCSTINMNACAAFILVTILFVSASNGLVFSLPQMIVWVAIATIAAIGNSSVPMGCYFVSSAFLASMGVPLYILGAILPFYTLLDMFETAVNVWSDACVATIVDKELAGNKAN
ncbi:dicarboxylate/amino acid:cation symporter, partial [Candidatus Dependentiae bacterium]